MTHQEIAESLFSNLCEETPIAVGAHVFDPMPSFSAPHGPAVDPVGEQGVPA